MSDCQGKIIKIKSEQQWQQQCRWKVNRQWLMTMPIFPYHHDDHTCNIQWSAYSSLSQHHHHRHQNDATAWESEAMMAQEPIWRTHQILLSGNFSFPPPQFFNYFQLLFKSSHHHIWFLGQRVPLVLSSMEPPARPSPSLFSVSQTINTKSQW